MKKIYLWDDWFAAGRFVLTRGIDFRCSMWAMISQVRSEASKRGVKISVAEQNDLVVVTVSKEQTCPS